MRKCMALFLALLMLLGACSAAAEALPSGDVYSVEAADEFCNAWDQYFAEQGIPLSVGYNLAEGQDRIESFAVMLNVDEEAYDYRSGLIPAESALYFQYDTTDGTYGLCVFSKLKDELEKAVIYTDDRVINNLETGNGHDGYDMWAVTMAEDDMLALLDCDMFTVRLTIGGKSEVFDVTMDEYDYLYQMIDSLLKIQLYTDSTGSRYLDPVNMPELKAEPTPEPAADGPAAGVSGGAYSFREDLDAVDRAAKSVFYVEIYDELFECLGNASGFVAFDEHLFVTNQHVIENAAYLKIWDEDNSMYMLNTVVLSDKAHDIALLSFPAGKKYASLEFNTDDTLKRGQPVVTIGSPNGFQGTVAFGNISAFPVIPQYGNEKCIQYTAPTSHGSSGGVLFDDGGKVIGITSAVSNDGQNLNFAVPIRLVQELHDRWDGKSYEGLGTERSWDTVGYTEAPKNAATPTPAPTEAPTPEPADAAATRVELTPDNFAEYFEMDAETSLDGQDVTFKYTLIPSDKVGTVSSSSSTALFVRIKFKVYKGQNDRQEIKSGEATLMIKRDEGYCYEGELKMQLDEVLETVYWDAEVTYAKGTLVY